MTPAFVFDLDGTLVDSEHNYLAAEQRLLAEHGIVGFDEAAKRRYVGISTREMMLDLHRRYRLAAPVDELIDRKNRYYLELAGRHTPVFPRMRDFVALLAERGHPLAVASGSSPRVLEVVLAGTGLAGHFDVVVSAEEVLRGKPEPDLFLEAARRLGVPPARCVVVEDARHGVLAAQRAGMACIAVPYLADEELPPGARTLVFPGGAADFDADAALAWLTTVAAA